ncbi:MAG: hypothetical protein J6Y62_03705, partial [Clostridia bacterium]|nr:hypothetical protein [Clostridia bacterium]
IGDEKPAVRRAVASNPAAGRKTLERLAYSSDIDLKRALARNDKATASLLDRLYTDAFVTNMIETDDERLLGKLAGLKNEIAENPHTGVSTLKKLAEDKDELVRVRVFLNGRTPAAVKRELIKDEKVRDHWLVRTGMEEAGGEIKKVYDKYKAGGDLDVKALAALFAGD